MGTNKKYSGYQSFDYLEKGKDYKEFKLIEGENAFGFLNCAANITRSKR